MLPDAWVIEIFVVSEDGGYGYCFASWVPNDHRPLKLYRTEAEALTEKARYVEMFGEHAGKVTVRPASADEIQQGRWSPL